MTELEFYVKLPEGMYRGDLGKAIMEYGIKNNIHGPAVIDPIPVKKKEDSISKVEIKKILDDHWKAREDYVPIDGNYRNLVRKFGLIKETCPYCDGEGIDIDARESDEMSDKKCPQCKGSGIEQ